MKLTSMVPSQTRQILETKHMKRALEAHMTTTQALCDLYVEEFFLYHLKGPCTTAVQQPDLSCLQQLQKDMLKEQQNMLAILDSQTVLAMMTEFDEKKERQSLLFKFVRTYMRMVLLIYMFIRATHVTVYGSCTSRLWMPCTSLQKYARLVPFYLAEMTAVQVTDLDIHQ